MVIDRLFKPRPAAAAGRALYGAAVAQARSPAFYQAGVRDTPEGRFELYALHVVLILHRLKQGGDQAAETAQALFDDFLRGLDDGLRELGVGDLSVGKKMRKLGEAFYGRVKSYDEALGPSQGGEALVALLSRTVLDGGDQGLAPALADYVRQARAGLAGLALTDVLAARVSWPAFRP